MAKLNPSKIVCIGLNYKKHAAELNMDLPAEPIIFLKPPTALCFHGDKIRYPEMSREVHYEAELGVVIGKKAQNIQIENAAKYIRGYVCANDVTARDLQKKDVQWTRAKGFDTFCPISTRIIPAKKVDPSKLEISALLNGKIVQHSTTADMIFNVFEIVSFVSQVMTLYPDDLILTGTPEGVGPMFRGDTISIIIDGVGELTNKVC